MRASWKNSLAVLLLAGGICAAQQDDLRLLANAKFEQPPLTRKRQVSYLFEGRHALVKYNPVSLVFGGLLYVYQAGVSHLIGAACPYEISCSEFSRDCIRRYGLLKGMPLTADRLTRCTRLALIDLVPGTDYSVRKNRIFDHPGDYARHRK